jgi:type IV secretory pathway VirB10-like protein
MRDVNLDNIRRRTQRGVARAPLEEGEGEGEGEGDRAPAVVEDLGESGLLKKVGKKKLEKMKAKEEKKIARQAEIDSRAERKKRDEEAWEERKRKEAEKEAERRKKVTFLFSHCAHTSLSLFVLSLTSHPRSSCVSQEEEEEKRRIEREKQEEEEYNRMKAKFSVEREGYSAENEDVKKQKQAEFAAYVKKLKVVPLEELSAHFLLRTNVCRLSFLSFSSSFRLPLFLQLTDVLFF